MIETTSWAAIWTALEEYVGRPVPAPVRSEAPTGQVRRLCCPRCGLEYADPLFGGTSEFYDYLGSAESYYDEDRWDLRTARDAIEGPAAVLDLGCGAGDFLAMLPASCTGTGADLSARSVEIARSRGLDARQATPQELAASNPASFDVVCAFQILEHLPRAADLLLPMVRCARPGGRIIISVPSRDRLPLNETAVLDWPPHHLTRWGLDQVRRLATVHGLEVVSVAVESRPLGRAVAVACYAAAGSISGRPRLAHLPGLAAPRPTVALARTRFAMVAVLRVPTA